MMLRDGSRALGLAAAMLSAAPWLDAGSPPVATYQAAAPDQLLVTVDAATTVPPFLRERALLPETLEPFQKRLAPAARAAFDAGVSNLVNGNWIAAELAFKRAITSETDSTAPLSYLAVTYAASGHDAEAASAWQMALVDGSDLPQIYDWLGGALMRGHDVADARTTYEEAIARWPADPRFVTPLAAIDASLGNGRQAIARLEAYLTPGHDDPMALYLAIDWVHQVHLAKAVVHGSAEDVALVRGWADRYAKVNGSNLAVVKKWVEELEREHAY